MPHPPSHPPDPGPILLIRFSSLGDLVSIARTAHALNRLWPHAPIHLLTSTLGAELYHHSSLFHQIHVWPSHWSSRLNLLKSLRAQRYGLFLNLHCNRLSHAIGLFIRADRKQHVGRGPLGRLFLPKLRHPRSIQQMLADARLHLHDPSLLNHDPAQPLINIPDPQRLAISRQLQQHGWNTSQPLYVLAPGSSPTWPSKRWPPQHFGQLAQILNQRNAFVVLIGSPSEHPLAERIRDHAPHALNLAGQTSLPQTLALLSLASAALTNDSGPMHLAAAVATPVLALFGPTDPDRFGPQRTYGPPHASLSANLPCSPCHAGICPLPRHHCMLDLSVPSVLAALDALPIPP